MDGTPYSKNNFDLNLSPLDDKYLVSIGSEKGRELLELIQKGINVDKASNDNEETVKTNRYKMISELDRINKKFELPSKNFKEFASVDLSAWNTNSNECVGCGGCTNICPTCYCLILNDESENNQFTKVRSYDSCQYHGYARVAGGGSPRPHMYQRFRNRYLCKLVYMKDNFDKYGCTGCGRCIDTCPAEIEFREVVKNINDLTFSTTEERN